MSIVATDKPHVVRILNPQDLVARIQHLEEIIKEMHNINPTHIPIRFVTKERWARVLQDSVNYFSKFIPQERDDDATK